jgi:hypothetical protein
MYSFLDHEAFHFGGGTGNLASLVKGLAGVGIGNRVIAVFDCRKGLTVTETPSDFGGSASSIARLRNEGLFNRAAS